MWVLNVKVEGAHLTFLACSMRIVVCAFIHGFLFDLHLVCRCVRFDFLSCIMEHACCVCLDAQELSTCGLEFGMCICLRVVHV